MSGWKTKLGGGAAIFIGLGTAIHAFLAGDWAGVVQAATVAAGGLAAVGLGHKADKVVAAVKEALGK